MQLPELPGANLEVTHAVKRFGGNVAVDDVSITARAGQVTGLIGPNGSGKTTLLNLISGYYQLSAGHIVLGSRRIDDMAPHKRARLGIARTFQTPSVPHGLTVRETVESARFGRHPVNVLATVLRSPRMRRIRNADRAEASLALAAVGLSAVTHADSASLPLGTRRLLEVARAICAQPSVLLLDEPASGLDEHEVAELGQLVRAVARAGATVILVEHNFHMVLDVCDHIYVLAEGSLLTQGDAATVRTDESVARAYLGAASDDAEPGGEAVPGAATSTDRERISS